jgi:hypothetical protein
MERNIMPRIERSAHDDASDGVHWVMGIDREGLSV